MDRMKSGEFTKPHTGELILPDEISYRMLLSACTDPMEAKSIVQEVRFDVGLVLAYDICRHLL